MTDEEIIKKISLQGTVAVVLSLLGRKKVAGLFAQHAIRLIAAHKPVVERWMAGGRALRRCSRCNAPGFGEFCSSGCYAADVTERSIDKGFFPDEEIETVRELAKSMERT